MRDLLANLFARLRGSSRQERLYAAAAAIAAAVLLRYGVQWLVDYRRAVKEDIGLTADRLANARRLLTRGPELEEQSATLQARFRDTVAELIPGDTPTLAAAALQERVSSLAAEKGVSVQTTQVMKDEALGPFRKVSLRITANADLRQMADFLASLELGKLKVSVPFIEVSRRGAARREDAPRAVSATLEIAGIVQGSAAPPAQTAGGGGGATAVSASGQEAAAGAGAPEGAANGSVAGGPASASFDAGAERVEIPQDPLGMESLAGQKP